MKHLILFNESKKKDELEDFCRNYLASMLDSFRYNFAIKETLGKYTITIRPEGLIKWNDIKDEFIPFLYMLNKEYTIFDYNSSPKMRINDMYYIIDNVLNDRVINSSNSRDYLYLLSISIIKDSFGS